MSKNNFKRNLKSLKGTSKVAETNFRIYKKYLKEL